MVAALKNGQVDGVVIDLPTAFYLTAVELENGKIVGQFSAPGGDYWGLLGPEGLPAGALPRPGDRRADRLG